MPLPMKLLLAPILIAAATLAGRKWGAAVSGWAVGLPLTSGPISFFLALDHGRPFAASAAVGTLLGMGSVTLFCVVYGALSRRAHWLICWLGGWLAFAAATVLLTRISPPAWLAYIGVAGALYLASRFLPDQRVPLPRVASPGWDLVGRMTIASATVFLLTGLAASLGPQLSGLLSPLPIFATLLTIFAHREGGPAAARQTLHGVALGSFSFIAFFLVVGTFLVPWGTAPAYTIATLAALATQGYSLWLLRLRTRSARS
jgi:hypothetical protein